MKVKIFICKKVKTGAVNIFRKKEVYNESIEN